MDFFEEDFLIDIFETDLNFFLDCKNKIIFKTNFLGSLEQQHQNSEAAALDVSSRCWKVPGGLLRESPKVHKGVSQVCPSNFSSTELSDSMLGQKTQHEGQDTQSKALSILQPGALVSVPSPHTSPTPHHLPAEEVTPSGSASSSCQH